MDQNNNSNVYNGVQQPVSTPVYGAPQPAATTYNAQQPAGTPTYGAPQPVPMPAYGAPQAVQTPVYVTPQPEVIYAQNINGQTVYVDANGNRVQPIFVDQYGRPVQQPAPPTAEQQAKQIRDTVRTDMGRHGAILLLGQLVSTTVLFIGIIIITVSLVMNNLSNAADIAGFTQSDMFQNSFGYMLCLAIASLLGNTLVFIPFAKKRGVRPFSTFTGGEKPTGKFFWGCMLAGLGLNYLWGFIYMGLCALFPSISNSNMGMDMSDYDLKTLIVYIVMVCIIAPVTEEFMFRGVLLHSLRRYGDRLAIITTALFFGLLHGNMAQTPMAFILGLVLGYIAVKTGSIWYPILIHFINNTYSTILSIAETHLPQYEDILNWFDLGLGALLAVAAVILLIVKRKSIQFPKDSEEVKAGPIRHRYATFFSAFWNIAFIVFMIGVIIMSLFTGSMMEDLQSSMDPGFIRALFAMI